MTEKCKKICTYKKNVVSLQPILYIKYIHYNKKLTLLTKNQFIMKKIFSLFIALMAAFSLSAQNLENGFYLAGSMNGWTAAEGYHFVGNPANPAEFMLETTLAEADEFKVINYLNGEVTAWFPAQGDNYVVDAAHAGAVTIYFQPDYKAEWAEFGGYFFIAVPEAPAEEWAEIVFTDVVEKDDLAADASFSAGELVLTINDANNKMAIDGNNSRFGVAGDNTKYTHRLKSGGKTEKGSNFLTVSVPSAGKLRVAVRSANGTDETRNLVIKQGEEELYNKVVKDLDGDSIMKEDPENPGTMILNYIVYPYIEVAVAAGDVVLSYPTGALNFYGFGFQAAETPEPVLPSIALIGGMNGWDGSKGEFVAAADKASASLTLDLAEMPQDAGYAFKLLVDGVAYGSERVEGNPFTFTRENNVLTPVDHVAVGDDEIFWLVMDVTGEYTFTYTFADSSLVVTYPVVSHTYTVAGGSAELFGTTWDPSNADNDMVKLEDGTYKWEKENLTIAAGSIGFKVCEDHAWTHAYPAQDYQLPIPEAGVYTITITFNPEGNVVAAIANKTGEAVVIPSVAMHGDFINKSWADTENFTVAEDNASASLTLNLAADNYEFGMRIGGSGNWTANGSQFTRESNAAVIEAGSGNLKLIADVDGDYVFTWTYATNTLTITFPAQEGIEEVVAAGKTVKIVRNGQMLIMKGDKIFNAQGTIVK